MNKLDRISPLFWGGLSLGLALGVLLSLARWIGFASPAARFISGLLLLDGALMVVAVVIICRAPLRNDWD